MIKIKAYFGEWREVDREAAKVFVKKIFDGITATSKVEERHKIAEEHLQGITVSELLGESDNHPTFS